ncbi:hypothetical protein GALMADRAFT_243005 [Galerina marginata CBS 339.88]|uniref:HMG box domain-containing protein n=1 Tax=Galerina marginata (strain CBS 339.88) TaxID=685588 RepID=A0A067TGU0_GALM3|nr:hypothetical protein GALMADRAFT_243005 [Galerina marginata CBS 339.88]
MLFSLLKRSPAFATAAAAGARSFSLLSKSNPALRLGVARPTASFFAAQAASRRAFLTTSPVLAAAAATTTAKKATQPKSKTAAAATKKPATTKAAAAGAKKKKTTAKKAKAATKKPKPKKKKKVVKTRIILKKKKKAVKPKKVTVKEITPPFKSPGSSWILFVKEFSKDRDPTDFINSHREAAIVWRTMSAEEKAKYKPNRAAVDEYVARRRDWVRKLTPPQRRLYRARHRSPALKGRASIYTSFVKENWKDLPADTTFAEKAKILAERYRELSEAQKEVLRQRVAKLNEERAAAAASSPPA